MPSPTPKELRNIANACRKAGIKQYKCADFEFTLTDEVPASSPSKTKKSIRMDTTPEFESDSLTEEQLLMWSTGIPGDHTTNG
jgi:hypothetical protein